MAIQIRTRIDENQEVVVNGQNAYETVLQLARVGGMLSAAKEPCGWCGATPHAYEAVKKRDGSYFLKINCKGCTAELNFWDSGQPNRSPSNCDHKNGWKFRDNVIPEQFREQLEKKSEIPF